jgi:hypothetical protein
MSKFKGLIVALVAVALFGGVGVGVSNAGGVKQSVEMSGGTMGSIADATCNATTSVAVPADTTGLTECWLLMVAPGSNPTRIGDTNCGASQCAEFSAGQGTTLCTTSAISCYSALGGTLTISKVNQ